MLVEGGELGEGRCELLVVDLFSVDLERLEEGLKKGRSRRSVARPIEELSMNISGPPRKHRLARAFSRWAPYLAVCFLVAVVAGFVVSTRYFQSETIAIYKQRSALTKNIERIRYYDEALTDSARLAAASGNRSYERRYERLVPQLDRLIKSTVTLVGTREAAAKVAQTDAANLALVVMEERSFRLDRQGLRAEATALLTGPEYLRQKKIYAAGANQAFASFLATSDRRMGSIARNRVLALLFGIVSALAMVVFGLFYLRRGREQARLAAENEQRRAESARDRAEEIVYHESQREFTETLQVTRDEDEVNRLLKNHLERSVADTAVVVFNRNNSENRLQPMTELPDDSPLGGRLLGAQPDSCLAVRLARPYECGGAHEPLLTCELCSGGRSTCVPKLVGGEVIGSVLVQSGSPLTPAERRRVSESVAQAAPVLANLRNLALANARALTDTLTGLPNKRSIEDTLKRMTAYAQRTDGRLAAIVFDLDHFKRVNDAYGHERGDDLLAAVGATVTGTLRASDFAGRFGGEEFVLLLPDTDHDGALVAAERLRLEIAGTTIPGLPQPVTASFGIAVLPDDATEAGSLLRIADRALYLAKSGGRNRVARILPDTEDEPRATPLALAAR